MVRLTDLDLGVALRQWRLQARLSQRDLALRIGFHEGAVSSIERGERAPSAQYLAGFVAVLNLDQAAADEVWRLYRQQPHDRVSEGNRASAAAGLCPYRGLLAFREEDMRLFYGRDDAVGRMVSKLDRSRLVAVVGASGSGKSSTVFAGVVPRLRMAAAWEVVAMRPGPDPFGALAQAMGYPSEGRGLFATGGPLTAIGLRTKTSSAQALLIIVDQLEELFTHDCDAAVVSEFLDVLVRVAHMSAAVPVKVMLTFRGDFYGRAIAHRGFSDVLQDNVVHLPPMGRAELRQAVTEPARTVGLTLEEGLADRVLDDAGDEPGNLPLLEFAMTRLWEQQQGRALTHAAYEQIGQLAGAITSRAEEVYGSLSPEEQYAARQLLVRLVQVARPGEDGNDARRRTPVAELAALPRVADVIAALADARLVVTDVDGIADPTIELAHEAIIRSWDRLRGWLMEDRQFLLWQQRARQWLEEWRLTSRSDDALLRGAILDEAVEWLSVRGRDSVGGDLLGYLDASVRESEAEAQRQVDARIDQLLSVRPHDVPDLAATFPWANPGLVEALRERLGWARLRERWRLRIALLPTDPDQAGQLIDEMDRLWPDEIVAVRDAMRPYHDAVAEKLWNLVARNSLEHADVLYAAVLLADIAPHDPRWQDAVTLVAQQLVDSNQLNLRPLVDALRAVRAHLIEPLFAIFADATEHRAAVRETTATILLDLAADEPTVLARMAADALPQNYVGRIPADKKFARDRHDDLDHVVAQP